MNEAAAPASSEREHIQIWARSFSDVLGQITGSPLPCVPVDDPASGTEATETDIWFICNCSGGLRGELSFRVPSSTVLALAQMFMSDAQNPEIPLTPEHREAALELLRQIAGVAASSLKPRWGEVQVAVELAPGPSSWSVCSQSLVRVGEGPAVPTFEIRISAALAAALRGEKTESDPKTITAQPEKSLPTAPNGGKLDLLMDVELGVVLRFGSRKLLLREVLDLNTGSVIDLDRQVQEPVEMLLDGRLLARGELVVLNGNYGLKVTEIASPS